MACHSFRAYTRLQVACVEPRRLADELGLLGSGSQGVMVFRRQNWRRPWSFAVCSNSSHKRPRCSGTESCWTWQYACVLCQCRFVLLPAMNGLPLAHPWSNLPGSQPACRVLSMEAESLSGVTLCLAIGYSIVIVIWTLSDRQRRQVVWRDSERAARGKSAARHSFPPPGTLSSPLRPLLPADGGLGWAWWRFCQSRTGPLRGKVALVQRLLGVSWSFCKAYCEALQAFVAGCRGTSWFETGISASGLHRGARVARLETSE